MVRGKRQEVGSKREEEMRRGAPEGREGRQERLERRGGFRTAKELRKEIVREGRGRRDALGEQEGRR